MSSGFLSDNQLCAGACFAFAVAAFGQASDDQRPRYLPGWPCTGKERSFDPVYAHTAEASGGHLFLFDKSEVSGFSKFALGDLKHKQTVVRAAGKLDSYADIRIPVDASIASLFVTVTLQCMQTVLIYDPLSVGVHPDEMGGEDNWFRAGRIAIIPKPRPGVWTVRLAQSRYAFGDTTFADSVLPRLLERSRHPEALLFAAALAEHRGDDRRRAALLTEVLARGGDSAAARAGLAALAAHAGHWGEVAQHLRAALAIARGSYRHPFPVPPLRDALGRLALTGPVLLADSVLAVAVRARSGWATLYELRAAVALRAGRCADAAAHFLELFDFGIEPTDGPEQLMRCRRGEKG